MSPWPGDSVGMLVPEVAPKNVTNVNPVLDEEAVVALLEQEVAKKVRMRASFWALLLNFLSCH